MPWACRRARWCGCTREGHGLRLRPRPAPRHGETAAGAGDWGAGGAARAIGRCWRRRCAGWGATGGSRPCSRSRLIARAGLGRRACRASGRGGGISARAWRGWCGGIRADGWRSSAATSPASAPPTWRPRSGASARAGGVRAGGGWRLLAGGARPAPARPSVRRGALVQRVRAGRHAGQLRRAYRRPLTNLERCGQCERAAQTRVHGLTAQATRTLQSPSLAACARGRSWQAEARWFRGEAADRFTASTRQKIDPSPDFTPMAATTIGRDPNRPSQQVVLPRGTTIQIPPEPSK